MQAIVIATHLPVAAGLENGFGDEPAACAETILLEAAAVAPQQLNVLMGASNPDFTLNEHCWIN